MYTLYPDTGEVFRNSDSKVVSPTSNPADADFVDYVAWVNSGNTPTVGELSPTKLAEQKVEMWRVIQLERDRRKAGGVLVGAHWFHSDDTSRIQFIGLLMYGVNMPNNIMWKTMAGAFVQMTPTLAQQIFGTIAAKDTSIFTVAETHKAQMNASSTPSTYNYLTGTPSWPTIFGE
jgi:hypothetical protein